MDFHHVPGRDHADHGRGAARPEHPERLLRGYLVADGLEGIVDPSPGQVADLLDHVAFSCIHTVRCAEFTRQFEFRCHRVHRDDLPCARDLGAVDAGQADATATDDGDSCTRLDSGGMNHRPNPRRDAAPDQRRAIQGHVLADLCDGMFVHEHVLGKGREIRELDDAVSVLRQPRRLVGTTLHFGRLAKGQVAGETVFAVATEHRQAGDDVVSGLDVGDIRSNRLDDARGLVAKDHRSVAGIGAVVEMHVGVADAGRCRTQPHLVRSRVVDSYFLDFHRCVDFTKYRSFHGISFNGFARPDTWACSPAVCLVPR